jgi:hypothetical protein
MELPAAEAPPAEEHVEEPEPSAPADAPTPGERPAEAEPHRGLIGRLFRRR